MLWDYELSFLTQANTFLLGKESMGRGKRLIEWERVGAAEAESKTSAWKVNLRCRTFTGCHSSSSFRYMLSLHVNKQWHQVRKGFIAFLLDDIACEVNITQISRFAYISCHRYMLFHVSPQITGLSACVIAFVASKGLLASVKSSVIH